MPGYGSCDMVLDWLKDFLSAQTQCVGIKSIVYLRTGYCTVSIVAFHKEVLWDMRYF